MKTSFLAFICLCAAAELLTAASPAWKMQFFHDQKKSSLVINDIKFCSPERGVAVGEIIEDRKKLRPVALVTSDGGAKWSYVKTDDTGISLFFLNETAGWMVTAKGIWFTDEAGRTWRRIKKLDGILKVHFLTREHGFAIGERKRVLETKDGGKTWTDLPALEKLTTSPERTVFHAIAFADAKLGIIAGRAEPRRGEEDRPAWLETEAKREWPALSVFLQTKNGGETWESSTVSLFGRFSQIQIGSSGKGLALVEFDYLFEYPSEVYRLDLRTSKTESALRRKDLATTGIAMVAGGGSAFAAGFEPVGLIARSPVPGRVRVLETTDLSAWKEMEVDYRAVATRVSVTAIDRQHAWIATDTGMILRLVLD